MRPFLLLIAVLLAGSCQPKETSEVGSTGVQADSLEAIVDSANNARQDGTVTVIDSSQDVKQQLPPELEVLLDQTHGLWQLAPVSDKARASFNSDQQGPYFLQTEVNGDNQSDYVVLLEEQGNAIVYAFIKPEQEGKPWQETVLEKKPLILVEGKPCSPLYLALLEEMPELKATAKAQQKGVLILEGTAGTLHQWQKGEWQKTVVIKGEK